MLVSNGLFIRHVGLQWAMSVSDGSLIKHVEVSDGSLIRHVGLRWVSDGIPTGLRYVSDKACWTLIGL